MNDSRVRQIDVLNSQYRISQAELAYVKKQKNRLVKWAVLGPMFGMFFGAFGMVYFETPKPQPVVHVETHIRPAMNDQRVKELRFSLQKLERLKDVHDATLREAATNQGDIRQMVERLEVR